MAKRLAVDDAIIRLSDYDTIVAHRVQQDLPVYLRDRAEKQYIQQNRAEQVYLCGKPKKLKAAKMKLPKEHNQRAPNPYTHLFDLCANPGHHTPLVVRMPNNRDSMTP